MIDGSVIGYELEGKIHCAFRNGEILGVAGWSALDGLKWRERYLEPTHWLRVGSS